MFLKKCEENGSIENFLVNIAKIKKSCRHDMSRNLPGIMAIWVGSHAMSLGKNDKDLEMFVKIPL